MTTLQALLQGQEVAGHCFAPDRYVRADIHSGLMESRGGYRLAAFPDVLLRAIYTGLQYETGQAARVILSQCGRQWGEEFYRRFETEMSEYYHQPVGELPLATLLDSLTDLWATHGWGSLSVNLDHEDKGILEIQLTGSGFATAARQALVLQMQSETQTVDQELVFCTQPSCYLETGILASFFSALAGRSLDCVQTVCESMGSPSNHFLVTTSARLQPVPDWVQQGIPHEEIMQRLLRSAG